MRQILSEFGSVNDNVKSMYICHDEQIVQGLRLYLNNYFRILAILTIATSNAQSYRVLYHTVYVLPSAR